LNVPRLSFRYGVLTFAYMGGLFYLSSLPGSATGPNTPVWRAISNAAHVPLFGGLGLCLVLAFRSWPARQRIAWVLGVATAYVVFDEWHQRWVPERSMSLMDIGLDLAGILVAVFMVPWRSRP